MKGAVTKLKIKNNSWTPETKSFCVGQIVRVTDENIAMVDYPGNQLGPVKARATTDVLGQLKTHSAVGTPVLVAFIDGDLKSPIIIGIIREALIPTTSSEEVMSDRVTGLRDVTIDGKKIVFDATKEIILRCGKSSVTLKKDGKIIVKGTQITNRASATNKIKGASVRIN